MSKLQGTVKWFNADKGFGFITPADNGKDLFVHFSGIIGNNFRSLSEGDKVEYNIQSTDRGAAAIEVAVLR